MCGYDITSETIGLFGGRDWPATLLWCAERPDRVGLRIRFTAAQAERWFPRAVFEGGVEGTTTVGNVTVEPGSGTDEGWIIVSPAPGVPPWWLTETAVGSFLAATDFDAAAVALLGEMA